MEEEVAEVEYNPFNLVYADSGRAFVTHYGEETNTQELDAEAHVLANMDIDDTSQPRIRRAREILTGLDFSPESFVESLRRLAVDHEEVEGQSICLHRESAGTVSSTIIAVAEEFPSKSLFLYSPGSPCQAEYEDYSSLLDELMA